METGGTPVDDLVEVLGDIGLVAVEANPSPDDRGVDAVLRVGKRRLPVEVQRDVREGDALRLVDRLPAHALVVADRFSPQARELLDEHGINWLDRRGHLRLVLPPGIFVDRDIDPVVEPRGRADNPFTTAGLDVAVALLLEPAEPLAVRELSRRTGVSAGRVSELLGGLREQGLVNRDRTPAVPELFEAVADAWKPRWATLGGKPPPDPGLRLGGLHAAIWYGVRLVVTRDWPPDLYVRDQFALRRLVRTYPPDLEGTISPVARAAVCPSPYGFDRAKNDNLDFPVVNHVVAALDLAQDRGRGREALAQWSPEGAVRVW